MSKKQCVRCGRVGHDSAECKWLSADSVNKPPLDVLAQLDLAETEVINAKAWSVGGGRAHCDFALTAIAVARQAVAAAEQPLYAQPPAVAHVPMQVAGKEDQAVYDSIAACYHQPPAVAVAVPQASSEGCTCKECGSTNLTWHTSNVIRSNVQQGRLNTNDVECLFYLGCDDCSETLMTLRADKVAGMLGSVAAAQKGGAA